MARDKQIKGESINNRQSKKVAKAISLLEDKEFCVLTGAGVSTASGIPDYRGEGSAPKKPLDYDSFITSEQYQKDFWLDGYQDWRDFSPAEPNDGHKAIAALEACGFVNGVITQNVDGLHYEAGSTVVSELHGNMYTTSCLRCGYSVPTEYYVDWLELGNPGLFEGDVDRDTFWIQNCNACMGPMKPDVTFFGENLPDGAFELATEIAADAEAMVVAGTSLNVMTPLSFVQMMKSQNKPIIIINKGPTQIDKLADVKIQADISEVFSMIADGITSPVYI